jgi:hypothetical protein
MENLVRGWAIVMAHWHGHSLAVWIASATGAWVAIWLAIWAARRERNEKDSDDESLRPKRRLLLPGSDRGLRP